MIVDIDVGCKLAVQNGLYLDGRIFEDLVENQPQFIEKMAIARFCKEYVGLAMIHTYPPEWKIQRTHIGVFVKPEYRGIGIGSQLIKELGGLSTHYWMPGEKGTENFWIQQ